MSIHNDSVNKVLIVLEILQWQVCFPFVYLQNASFNPFIISILCVSHRQYCILNRKDRDVCCRYIPLALHWVTYTLSNFT